MVNCLLDLGLRVFCCKVRGLGILRLHFPRTLGLKHFWGSFLGKEGVPRLTLKAFRRMTQNALKALKPLDHETL